jgi:hypothetical protein
MNSTRTTFGLYYQTSEKSHSGAQVFVGVLDRMASTITAPAATASHAAVCSSQPGTHPPPAPHQLAIQMLPLAGSGSNSLPPGTSNGSQARNTSQPQSTHRPPDARQCLVWNISPTAMLPKINNWSKCVFNGAMFILSIVAVVFAIYQTMVSAWTARKDFRDDCFNQRVSGPFAVKKLSLPS